MPYDPDDKRQHSGKRDYPNSGVLFKNDDKQRATHKDFGGNGELDCPFCQAKIEMWLSAWIKQSQKDGRPFLSVSFEPKVQSGKRAAAAPTIQVSADDILAPVTVGQKAAPAQGTGLSGPPPSRRKESGNDPTGIDSLPSTREGSLDFDDDIPF